MSIHSPADDAGSADDGARRAAHRLARALSSIMTYAFQATPHFRRLYICTSFSERDTRWSTSPSRPLRAIFHFFQIFRQAHAMLKKILARRHALSIPPPADSLLLSFSTPPPHTFAGGRLTIEIRRPSSKRRPPFRQRESSSPRRDDDVNARTVFDVELYGRRAIVAGAISHHFRFDTRPPHRSYFRL